LIIIINYIHISYSFNQILYFTKIIKNALYIKNFFRETVDPLPYTLITTLYLISMHHSCQMFDAKNMMCAAKIMMCAADPRHGRGKIAGLQPNQNPRASSILVFTKHYLLRFEPYQKC